MKSKSIPSPKTGKITFKTKDGNLIMNKESDMPEWDKDSHTYILNCYAREKGVKILLIQRDGKNFDCIVAWL